MRWDLIVAKKILVKEKYYNIIFKDAVILLTCGQRNNETLKILAKNLNLILKCIRFKKV